MSKFSVLTGKALTKAIKGYGATAATFSAKTHQLAYSALAHADAHHCASHLNNLYAVTPTNYRPALRMWATDLGNVAFKAEPEVAGEFFSYAKGKESDLPKAMDIGPVEYQRAATEGAEKAFDEVKTLEAFLKKCEGKASVSTINAIEGALRLLKKAAPAATAPKVARKPKVVVDNAPAAVELVKKAA